MDDSNRPLIPRDTSLNMNNRDANELKSNIILFFEGKINEITLNLYDGVDELIDLDLSNRSIKVLPNKLFGSIKSFKNINFSNNQIENIPNDLFENGVKLSEINFNSNKIKKIPNCLFQNAEELSNIHFENNEIEKLPNNLFKNAIRLMDIHFNNNNIGILPDFLFQNVEPLDGIRGIYFNKNHINKIPDSLFKNSLKLVDIHFENNQILEINSNLFKSATKLKDIHFENNNLKEIPENLFKNAIKLEDIFFNNNLIEIMPEILFPNLKSWFTVKGIYFNDNKLKKIPEKNLFKEATSISDIHFENNKIEELPENIFEKAIELEEIHFKNNLIEGISEKLFENATKLKEINFSNNQIKVMPHLFHKNNIVSFDGIYFDNNKIDEIPEELFQNAKNLERIHFENNKIKKLSKELFKNAKVLKYIHFEKNDIEDIDEDLFEKATTLEAINFNDNWIKTIPENLFSSLKSIKSIRFNNNKIEEIKGKLFKNATELNHLYFNNNQIEKIPSELFEKATELSEIHFSNNVIKNIPKNLFKNATKLSDIHFEKNQLESIPDNLFQNAKTLINLYFNNNRIKFLPSNIFQKANEKDEEGKKLSNIHFENNLIETLPENIFSNAESLDGIDLSWNKLKDIPKYIFSKLKVDGLLDFSNNQINQYEFNYLKKLSVTEKIIIDFRFNIDSNDISVIFNNFFKENISNGIERIDQKSDLFNRLFIFYSNKTTFFIDKHGKNNFKEFENNLEKLRQTKSGDDKLGSSENSLLDFFVSFKKLDSFWILLFENFIQNLIKQNVPNLELKFLSSESIEAIFERNNLNLIETFFTNELHLNEASIGDKEYVFDPKKYFIDINFTRCFEIVYINDNEKMAIYLFKIIKYVFKRKDYLGIKLEKVENILKIQEAFSFNYDFREEEENRIVKKDPIVKRIFEKNWNNLIESILDDAVDGNYIELTNDKIKRSDHILMLINESKNDSFLNHETTKKLLDNKWKLWPRRVYYFHFLLYFSFIVFYSQNTRCYNWISFFIISYFTFIELIQLIDSGICIYFSSSKNIIESVGLPFCFATLIIINSGSLGWKINSSLYSLTIILSYWMLILRLDKFDKIGKYVDVFGSIIKQSIPLFIIVLINLWGFVISFRNRANFNLNLNKNQIDKADLNYQMERFNGSFENSIFKALGFLVGGIEIDEMGIDEFNSVSYTNFFIYGFFIFIMTILFINIFTGISIDEVQKLIDHSAAEKQSRKIEYVFKLESLKISEIYERLKTNFKKIKKKQLPKFFKSIYEKLKNFDVNRVFYKIFCKNLSNQNREKTKINNEKINQIIVNELDKRMKVQISELKMIIQSQFESVNRNIKRIDSLQTGVDEKISKMNQKTEFTKRNSF